MKLFGSLTGLTLNRNRNKTEGLRIGKLKHNFGNIYDFIINIFPIIDQFLFSHDIV
jgi:hypothetical protein